MFPDCYRHVYTQTHLKTCAYKQHIKTPKFKVIWALLISIYSDIHSLYVLYSMMLFLIFSLEFIFQCLIFLLNFPLSL